MEKFLIFNTYNELNKIFEVRVVQLTENKFQFELVKRPKVYGAKTKSVKTKQPTIREILLSIQNDIQVMKKDIHELKEWRKTVDGLFKTHGWIK